MPELNHPTKSLHLTDGYSMAAHDKTNTILLAVTKYVLKQS